MDFSSETAALNVSGRQDLNLRPLGPEGQDEPDAGVASGGTEWQAAEFSPGDDDAPVHRVAPSAPGVSQFGAPVVRAEARLLTVTEIAVRLGVCRATVYRLCDEGKLTHIRISGAIRVDDLDLEAFIGSQKLAPIS